METVQVTSSIMPDNDTLVHASTESDFRDDNTVFYISSALTTATLIYGVTSWRVIKKFRNYRNFVFLNAILAYFLLYLLIILTFHIARNRNSGNGNTMYMVFAATILFVLLLYLKTVKLYWLIVICHMFYGDIVKVFNGHIQRRYLKSCLFAWAVPLLTSFIYSFVISAVINLKSNGNSILFFSYSLPMILNSLLYIVILCSLFCSSNASTQTATKKWRRLYIATLIFILSDGFMFSSSILSYCSPGKYYLESVLHVLNSIILNVYLVFVKRNRELWYEFYVNKLNERQRNRSVSPSIHVI